MLGREIVKGKQRFFIFLQAFAGFWELDLVTGDELIVGRQRCFAGRRQVDFVDQLLRFALNTFGHFIQDVGCLMDESNVAGRLDQIVPAEQSRNRAIRHRWPVWVRRTGPDV
jgi:hypothetical protein